VSDSGATAGHDDQVIRQLRELHAGADDENRPRAALYLGLALADHVAGLPAGHPDRSDLAEEGLARLAESAGTSPAAAAAAAERLKGAAPARPEPTSFPLPGGDLNWDLDWAALRGPAEAGRNLAAMLPVLAAMLPSSDASLRNALISIKDVLDTFERGQWTPRGDAVLSAAIEQVETSDLGTGTGLILRVFAMTIRMQRCLQALKEGGQPDWPSLADLDRLIAGLESDTELGASLGGPFGAVEGLHHNFIATTVMMRITVSIRAPGARRDAAWRDDTLRLLARADDHLRQVPPAYAGLMEPLRGRLAAMSAALSGAAMPPGAAAPRTAFRPSPPSKPPAPAKPPSVPVPAAPAAPAGAAASGGATAWWSSPLINQLSPQVLNGLQVMTSQLEGPTATVFGSLLLGMEAVTARKWDPGNDVRLAELEADAGRLAAADQPLPGRAMVAATLAMTHALRSLQRAGSPRPAEHPSADDFAAVLAEIESALALMDTAAADRSAMSSGLSSILHALAAMMLVEISRLDAARRAELLARARGHFDQVPADIRDQLPIVGDMSALTRLMEGVIAPDDQAVDAMADRHSNLWDRQGLGLQRALVTAERARKSRMPADIGSALIELQLVWAGLAAGSPVRAQVLIAMARMQSLLTVTSGHQLGAEIASTAIAAVRTATGPGELGEAAHLLVTTFALMLSRGERAGPFREAMEALHPALADMGPDDWAVRTAVLTATGAAAALAAVAGDDAAHAASRQAIADAERALPDPQPTRGWYATARLLCTWTTVQGISLGDDESARRAIRLADSLQALLSSHPGLAPAASDATGPGDQAARTELEGLRQLRQQVAAAHRVTRPENPADRQPGDGRPAEPNEEMLRLARARLEQAAGLLGLDEHGVRSRRPSTGTPLDLDALHACATDLHAALPAAAADTRLRHQLDRMLGICHARLCEHGPAAQPEQGLREAVIHLNRALATADRELPAVEWADTLDVLAQCLRQASQRADDPHMVTAAERVARAALRELADCVLVADDTSEAVEVAAHANEIVARAIGWCLADGRYPAAVDIAETGRGLVLASVVLSGRVEEVLRGAGLHAVADAWSSGADRAAALNAVRDTEAGRTLLSTPSGEETSATLAGTPFDAVIYLVPPTAPDWADVPSAAPTGRTGHAILIHPVLGHVDVVELPELTGLGRGTPLGTYLAALDRAQAESDPHSGSGDGFRGGPAGQAWASALDEVGRWAYACIVGPLLDHIREWRLGHLPHLALIPLGGLAAIPYAAAWTDSGLGGERRYAIEDVMLSYAASARLLGEAARRPRRPLADRVVLVTNPDGELPMTRRATRLLASHQYQDAEVYGAGGEANGAATVAALLGALPAGDRPGASLLQLSTHGRAEPAPGLKAKDGWLALARILGQARGRAPQAPGGLVITNACLTDTTRTHYDESLTLATAFLAGGATAVIGTRWPVDDDTVAVLSLRLHYYLQLGRPPAEALRQAQLDMLRPPPGMLATLGPVLAELSDARLSHAASWAGHVHHGI
jgi:hypothetical protein